jgi:DNA-binding XRE family transcriptional regulator
MAVHKLENYLRTYRKRAGISQNEMGYLLGGHDGTKPSRYEHFKRAPSLETALACEALFQTPVRELFAGMYERAERRTVGRARLLRKRLNASGVRDAQIRKLLDEVVDGKSKRAA